MSAAAAANPPSMAMPIKTRRIAVSDPIHMPENYSTTPGGTLYSTSPGGSKIIYERAYLRELRGSPLSQSPPVNIPLCLLRGKPRIPFRKCVPPPAELIKKTEALKFDEQEQFQLEM